MIIYLNGNSEDGIYEQFLYPAGEMQVRLTPKGIEEVEKAEEIQIVARIKNASDIVELRLIVDAIESINSCPSIIVILPYLPYSRADRRFVNGDCFGLKIFGDLINIFNRVVTLDVHSLGKAQINIYNFLNVDPYILILEAITHFAYINGAYTLNVLYPDKGAMERYGLPKMLDDNIQLNIFNCNKNRDPKNGKLLGFSVPALPEYPTIIVDDICDGGGTFLGIANEIPKNIPLALYVSHGIFSKGFTDLLKHFKMIYTTDSITQIDTPKQIHIQPCLQYILQGIKNHKN